MTIFDPIGVKILKNFGTLAIVIRRVSERTT
jgi:hypothetical protein